MNKLEFLFELNEKLIGIPEDDRSKALEYYSEIIEDAVLDGSSEEQVIKSLGNIDDIVKEVLSSISLPKLIKNKIKRKNKINLWQLPLLILGGLIVLPIALSLFAIAFAVLISLWSLVIVFYAISFSFACCILVVIPMAILAFIGENPLYCLAIIACCLILAGISIPLFYLSKLYLKFMIYLSKHSLILIKKCFIKGDAK